MKCNKWPYIAWVISCIGVSAAVATAIYATKSAWCLWGLLFIPSLKRSGEDEE